MARPKGYFTQWAAQFYVAAELSRRGYLVALPLGNAPSTDMVVESPGGVRFSIDVKGLSSPSFWLIKRREPRDDLYYVLVYVPRNPSEPPRYFIFTSRELMEEVEKYRQRVISRGGKPDDRFDGINWSTAVKYENRWDILPE